MTTIMVVEDNPDNVELVQAFLEDQYHLACYEDGFTALDALTAHPLPELILCDISLPDMNGIELLHKIRSNTLWQHIPVIALTSHAMKGDKEKFLASGFDQYISKPLEDENMLLEPIRQLLGMA